MLPAFLLCSVRLLLALLLLCTGSVWAQGVSSYGIDQGLTSRSGMNLAQDRRGFLWYGTEHGLARFDGVRFRMFEPHSGDSTALGGWVVHGLAPDRRGDGVYVWCGAAGLQRFVPRLDRFVSLDTGPLLQAGHVYVNALRAAPDGTLWLATGKGLFRWTATGTRRLDPSEGIPLDAADVAFDASGRAWAATERGVFRAASGGTHAEPTAWPTNAGPARGINVWNGKIVAGTDAGVWEHTGSGWALRLAVPRVRHFAADPYGTLWLGTPDGLFRWDGRQPFATPASTAQAALAPGITDMLVDRGGTRWTIQQGRLYATGTRPSPFARVSFLGDAPFFTALVEPGTLWLGGKSGRMLRCAGRADCQPVPNALRYGELSGLARGADGTLYVAAVGDGLFCLPSGTTTLQRCPGTPDTLRYPYSLAAEADGRLWLGTADQGLYVRDLAQPDAPWQAFPVTQGSPREDALGPFVLPIVPRGDGQAWVGTMGHGLFLVDARTGTVRRIALTDVPDERIRVTSLARGNGDTLYAATLEYGVVRVVPRGKAFDVRWSGVRQGLASNAASAVVRDADGRIWAFAGGAVSHLRADSIVHTYGPSEGWPDAEAYWNDAYLGADRKIYVLTEMGGYTVFDPKAVAETLPLPALHLTNVRIRGQQRLPDATYAPALHLRHDENVVAVDLSTTDPSPVRPWTYAYRLAKDGRNDAWQSLRRTASVDLAGLAPGRYRLDARTESAGRYGPVQSMSFVIAPPWHGTVWARGLFALLGAAVLAAAYRARVAHLLALERTRRRIADDLHDDLGSKLAALAAQLDVAGLLPAETLPTDRFRGFASAARGLVGDLRDAVWLIDASADRLDCLAEKIEASARAMLPRDALRVTLDPRFAPHPIPSDVRRHTLLAVREMLHNAARHREDKPVDVVLTLETQRPPVFVATVRDHGPGLPDTFRPHGRGLATLRRRAEAMGGTFALENHPDGGAIATLRVPIKPLRPSA